VLFSAGTSLPCPSEPRARPVAPSTEPKNGEPIRTQAPTQDAATYVVLDEFPDGRIFRKTDEAEADRETVIQDILSGQYKKPVRVIAFYTAEGWGTRRGRGHCSRDRLRRHATFVERVSDLLPVGCDLERGPTAINSRSIARNQTDPAKQMCVMCVCLRPRPFSGPNRLQTI
jgi:hypothetical protein